MVLLDTLIMVLSRRAASLLPRVQATVSVLLVAALAGCGGGTGETGSATALEARTKSTNAFVPAAPGSLTKDLRCTGSAGRGWCSIPVPLPVVDTTLQSIQMVDGNVGFAVGDATDFDSAGKVFRTEDGGVTWNGYATGHPTDAGSTFDQVTFLDSRVGWTVGETVIDGQRTTVVWGSTDGGLSWTRATDWLTTSAYRPESRLPRDLRAFPGGKVLVTEGLYSHGSLDGGRTWTRVDMSTGGPTSNTFTPIGDWWRVTMTSVSRSSDLGRSFTTVSFGPDLIVGNVGFLDGHIGWAVGSDGAGRDLTKVWKTTDGGATWVGLSTSLRVENWGVIPSLNRGGEVIVTPYSPTVVDFKSQVWGSNDPNRVRHFRSSDAGVSWQQFQWPGLWYLEPNIRQTSETAFYYRPKPGVCTDFVVSTDSMRSWRTITVPGEGPAGDARYDCPNATLQMQAGDRGPWFADFSGRVYRSTDQGASWAQVLGRSYELVARDRYVAVWSTDGLSWTAFDSRVSPSPYQDPTSARRLESSDGGRTWSGHPVNLGYATRYIRTTANGRGWVPSRQTEDGGLTWTATTLPSMTLAGRIEINVGTLDHHFADDLHGWITRTTNNPFLPAFSDVLSTADGGLTWTAQGSPPLVTNTVFATGADRVFVGGRRGSIARSDDGGRTWVKQDTGIAESDEVVRLHFADGQTGWALASDNTIVRTTDGGATWLKTALPASAKLNDIRFADSRNGWVVGARGTIFATADGGVTWQRQASGSFGNLIGLFVGDNHTVWAMDDQGQPLVTETGGHIGQASILWQNTIGDIGLWSMNGTALSSGMGIASVPNTEWQVVATGDFNGDGKRDILWQSTANGDRVLWYMDGPRRISGESFAKVPPEWRIVGTGDFNGDGKTDIVFQASTNGDRVIWFMDGARVLSGVSFAMVPPAWSIVAVEDFDRDGKPDIVWQKDTGEVTLWTMNGTTLKSTADIAIVAADPQWRVVGTGDFNGDGKPELVWQHIGHAEQAVWFMDGPTMVGYASIGSASNNWRIAGVW